MLLGRLFFPVLFFISAATPNDRPSFAGKDVMNGMRRIDFGDFSKDWHFVTVRFRKDTGEMRFVYANDKAWTALNQGVSEYPDGAIFGKIGVATQDDLAFPSSAVPKGARRYQFMIRNQDLYKDTNGWGYALFDADGKTFPEDPKTTTLACAACHNIVPERGRVFSEPMGFLPFQSGAVEFPSHSILFEDEAVTKLPPSVTKLLPKGTNRVRVLTGDISHHLFQGTLDEVRPILAKEALRTHHPAILKNQDTSRFSVVFEDSQVACNDTKKIGVKGISNVYFKPGQKYEISFCLFR